MTLCMWKDSAEQKAIQSQHMVHITNYWGVCQWGEDEESGSHRGSLNMEERKLLVNLEQQPQVGWTYLA